MDRVQILLVGLPIFLLFTDLINLFTPPQPPTPKPFSHPYPSPLRETLEYPSQKSLVGGIGIGSTVVIRFCSSCSYRGSGMSMKKMLEAQFPGIDVYLANYPPRLLKRVLAKLVPVAQMGVIGIVVAGDHIFPMLGRRPPFPSWYYSLRANKFGTFASAWFIGNTLQSFLESSGAFEVTCNGDLVFSKLVEGRFPGEIELKELVGKRLLMNSRMTNEFSYQ